MPATATPDAEQQRAVRRRRLQQRQTVIFGGLIAVMLVIGLIAAAMWAGMLPAPFSREFTSASPTEEDLVTPCVPEGATPVAFPDVTANVYNGTDRRGLAGATAASLGQLGVVVNQQANWPQGTYSGAVQIVVGPLGVTAGNSVARLFPGAVVTLDGSRTDETIDIVLGATYESMLPAEEIAALDPATPLVSPEGCTPVASAGGAPA
ncbi:LytR family transcriptional regulator [Georgenia yuyongxinii]|uniref:LytR family transcriptional regulator n=1 Tax=Georgenia yuyongxinii TaxID=2589797 RepID=A0A5B8C2S8_9MICO|nr:LytR C-terminal domain-containing protein [Georgenia yuyongxinii]QDC23535.1 LytR family transcriptional regulator [Georgenia yuyongxinii]